MLAPLRDTERRDLTEVIPAKQVVKARIAKQLKDVVEG